MIAINRSVPFGAYGGAMANAAQQERYGEMMNPYIRQFFEQEYQSGEATRNRNWRTGERIGSQEYGAGQSALDRAQQLQMQQGQQQWQGGQSALDRAQQLAMQTGQQKWQTGESELDREQQRWQTGYLNPQTTSLVFRPAYTGPGSFAYNSQQIHQKHFGY